MLTTFNKQPSDLVVAQVQYSGIALVTGISRRGMDLVALLQEHGATAHGNHQCTAQVDLLEWGYTIHRGLKITEVNGAVELF